MIDPRSGRTERRHPLALIATSVDTRLGASAGTPRDECFHNAHGPEADERLGTFRVLAKGDLDADTALASGVGWRHRRGR
jgi:hypothetical protein